MQAARGDRRQHLAGAVGEQHEVRERRRLLERLEHPVGGLVVHRVGALDHEHAPARLERGARGGGDDGLVDVGHEHVGRAAGGDPGQIGVHAVERAAVGGLGVGGAVGQQRGGERAGGAGLAGSRRAVEQVGVRGRAVGGRRR